MDGAEIRSDRHGSGKGKLLLQQEINGRAITDRRSKQYECTNIYHGFIDVLDEHRELIKVSLDDSDFLFVLNAKEDDIRKILY